MQLNIINNTGKFEDSSIFFYVIGKQNGLFCHVKADGSVAQCQLNDADSTGFVDYSIPLATKIELQQMVGARVYFSIGDKMKIGIHADSGQPGGIGLVQPAPWTPADPNVNVLFDWIEFAFDANGFNCNTTMVDMFSIPVSLHLSGDNNQTAGALVDGARPAIFTAFQADSSLSSFSNLVMSDLRIVAPRHGIQNTLDKVSTGPTFAADYLDGYIADCWTHYKSNTLTVDTGANGVFTGSVDETGQMNFTRQGSSDVVKSITMPQTIDVFSCDGNLHAENNTPGAITARVGAALNRTTLLDNSRQPDSDSSTFYKKPQTNLYSMVMHANSRDGRAYGFAFDDVGGFQPTVADPHPTALEVTLEGFGSNPGRGRRVVRRP
jgi:hypothetical protein